MRKIETLEMALERIKELEAENQKLNEEFQKGIVDPESFTSET